MTSIEKEQIVVYPNPTRDNLRVVIGELNEPVLQIAMNDMLGQMANIKFELISGHEQGETKEYEIDVSSLPTGTYQLTVRGNTFVSTKKILIIR